MGLLLVKDPLYHQLNRMLREHLRSGKLRSGDRFWSEREVSEHFRVSRVTANKAISNLVSEGLLEFRRGVGTFVRGGVLDYDLRSLVSFIDKARAAGKKPETDVLAFEKVLSEAAPADVSRTLRTHPKDELFQIERLRKADGVPVIFEKRYVVARFCEELGPRDAGGSLYGVWTQKFKLAIDGAEQVIRAVAIEGQAAKRLEVKSGSAGLCVTSIGYLASGDPLWWEETLYRGEAYEFHNRLGQIQTARPATGVLR